MEVDSLRARCELRHGYYHLKTHVEVGVEAELLELTPLGLPTCAEELKARVVLDCNAHEIPPRT
jgi:hypothetical protein